MPKQKREEDLLVVALLVALALVAAVLHAAVSAAQVLEEDEVGDVERSVEHDGARVEVNVLAVRNVPGEPERCLPNGHAAVVVAQHHVPALAHDGHARGDVDS
mgnify:CR=1 FL=1